MGKKRLTLHLAAFLAVALFAFLAISSGAYSTPIVYDDRVPPEESTTLYFVDGLEITAYNGIPISTKKDILAPLGMKSEWRHVTLPKGKIEFEADAVWSSFYYVGNLRYQTDYIHRNIAFTYTFEPGEHYMLWFVPLDKGPIAQSRWGIQISKELPKKKWEVVDNVVIVDADSGSGERIILQ